MVRFEAEWLTARRPYDEAALDPGAVRAIRAWAAEHQGERALVVVDLGSGTGTALGRVHRWLAPREIVAYAVDHDAALLRSATTVDGCSAAVPIVGDLLEPLEPRGGPPDGTVDLVVGHALADLMPLDRLAARARALVRPGGLVHLALAYDGLTTFSSTADANSDLEIDGDLDAAVLAAFHRHMDRPAAQAPTYGGSTAGRRLGPALQAVGLEIISDAPAIWNVRASDGLGGRTLLAGLLRFILEAAREMGDVPAADLEAWGSARQTALAREALAVRVGHRDVLARVPVTPRSNQG